MIVPVMAISNLVLTRQIYSEETNGAHAHHREPVPLNQQSVYFSNTVYFYWLPVMQRAWGFFWVFAHAQ